MKTNRKSVEKLVCCCAVIAALSVSVSAYAAQGCCGSPAAQHDAHHVQAKGQAPVTATIKKGVQYATIVVDSGYQPAQISAKAGVPMELTFKLGKKPGCASVVSFPGLKIKKEVPAGKGLTIKFTPKEAGDVPFECGMGMTKGKVIVK